MRRQSPRGTGFWNSTGQSRTRFRPGSNLWERQNPHPAHPTTVRLQAPMRGDGSTQEDLARGISLLDHRIEHVTPPPPSSPIKGEVQSGWVRRDCAPIASWAL